MTRPQLTLQQRATKAEAEVAHLESLIVNAFSSGDYTDLNAFAERLIQREIGGDPKIVSERIVQAFADDYMSRKNGTEKQPG